MGKVWTVRLALFCAFAVGSASAEGWWMRGGPVYRGGMDIEGSGSSYVQEQNVHAGRVPVPVGVSSAYGNRVYDDGYVRVDPGTGNSSSIDPSVTWYWGYENAGQHDPGAGTLSFSKSMQGYVETRNSPFDDDDNGAAGGIELQVGRPLRRGHVAIDACIGLQALWGGGSLRARTYEESVGRATIIDTYDASAITMPDPGHQGTYAGPFDTPAVIPSPVIPNVPSSRSSAFRSTGSVVYNDIDMDVDTDLYALWIGSRFAVQPTEALSLGATPRVSLNYVDASVERDERFILKQPDGATTTLASWHDCASESEWLLGLGITTDAFLETERGLLLGASVGYDWMLGDVDVQVGPNKVSVDPSGYSVNAIVGWRFGGGGGE